MLTSLLPEAVGTGAYLLGVPGAVGTPTGTPAPGLSIISNQGTGWELTVLAAPDFHTWLAYIPSTAVTGVQVTKQLSSGSATGSGAQPGSASVSLNMDDALWSRTLPNGQPAHYLLDFEHCWQIWKDGVLVFEFLGTTITEQLVDPSEQRIATVTGNDLLQTLKWAIVAPPGFPNNIVYKLDAITDGFSEINSAGQPVLDTGLWNASSPSGVTLNPLGSAQVMAGASATTFLGSTVYDATDTLISAQVNPILQTSSGVPLDGSQLSQMYIQDVSNPGRYLLMGLSGSSFYWQYSGPTGTVTHVIATNAAYQAAQQGAGGYSYWQFSEHNGVFFIWTSPDGQNWTLQGQQSHSGWNPTAVGLYFTSFYDVASTFYTTVTALNSNVTTSSLGGPTFFNSPIMAAWVAQLAAAQARGTVPFIATGQLSGVTDSYGNLWNDSQSVQLSNGTDLLTLLQAHASMINADYIMQPGARLVVGIPEPGKVTLGTDRSATVIFREGHDLTVKTRTRTRNLIQNLLGVINADGRTTTSANATSAAQFGQREGWVQAAVQVTQADIAVVAAAVAEDNASEILTYTAQILPGLVGHKIFTDFQVGDWVGLERPDFSATDAVRVVAVSVQLAADGAETYELTLVSYIAWLQGQLAYIAGKLGGNFVSAAGTTPIANNASITNQNAPTVFAPTLAGLGGVLAGGGSAGAPLVYNPVSGLWAPAGSVNPVSGQPVPMVVSGSGGTVAVSGSGGTVTVTPPQPGTGPADGTPTPSGASHVISYNTTTITDATGTTRTIIGAQADGTFTSQDVNGPAPAAPDNPTVTGTLSGILVGWDGLLAGAAPLSDFLWTEVHVSTASGFTPSGATLKATMITAGVSPVVGLTVGTTYYVKLMARNTSGVAGTPSAQASAVPTAISASALGLIGVLNINPYFAGGDGSTWAGVNGTFAVSSSPSAGSPYTYAGQFTVTTSGVGAAAKESGDPFPVQASAQYLATAWCNTPTTSVVLGFDFFTGANGGGSLIAGTFTQTVTVTANTWTLVTVVITAPSNAQSGWLRVAPADGVSNTIYVEAIYALPQVPGGLVQAGTITATQIAAATITAAQIASGTITATQIAAATITGGLIASGTITASNIASGTITAGLLAAGIVKAGIVDGTTISGAQFIAHGTSGEVLVYSGTPATGNLIGSWSATSGTDSVSNNFPAGLTIGLSSSTQVSLVSQAGAGRVVFLLNSGTITDGFLRAVGGSFGQILLQGPQSTVTNFNDSVGVELNSSDAVASSSNFGIFYNGAGGGGGEYLIVDAAGVHIVATKELTGIHPGSGTGPTNPATSETWQAAGFANSWAGSGSGVNGLFYRFLPWGAKGVLEVIADIQNTTATGNSVCNVALPSGYRPAISQNHEASWNNPQGSNAASAPWIFYDTSGNIQVTGLQVANKAVFFHNFVPLDSTL